MVSRWFPGRMGLANAVTTSGIGVGQLLIIASLAAALADIGWRNVYVALGIVNLALVPVVFAALSGPGHAAPKAADGAAPATGMTLAQALRTRRFWLLVFVYAVCGFQDFFVATHMVAFAQDKGVDALFAGNLLALMGLTGVAGVLLAGVWSDRSGPGAATLFCFVLRVAIFGLILADQSTVSVAAFALLYGTTFWLTAPLTVVFARMAFGTAHLGAISGLIVMIHHMCGGLGAWIGAVLFDVQGRYDLAFALMLGLSLAALVASFPLRGAGRTSHG
jgi:predicted MFS family arabinose efflux permease